MKNENVTRKPSAGRCPGSFDEDLISGYLDRTLTQSEEQKVRLHLESCASCSGLFRQLEELRKASLSTRFVVPEDRQWNEAPWGPASRFARGLGWTLILAWAVAVAGFAVWEVIHSSEGMVTKLLVFSGVSGFSFLGVSVLIDRLRALPGDRYRRVQK